MRLSPAHMGRWLASAASLHMFRRHRRRNRGRIARAFAPRTGVSGWLGLSEWLALDPDHVDVMMMIGPRWNCHAVIGVTGFIDVRGALTIDAGQAEASARHWTVVVYDAAFRTVAHVGTAGTDRGRARRIHLDLKPGKYLLGLRYYGVTPEARYPEVQVDGVPVLPHRSVGDEPRRYQTFLRELRRDTTRRYTLLHYHAYGLLRSAPGPRARAAYLPVGNPETGFAFGAAPAGSTIHVEPSREEDGESYLAVYDRGSRPLHWARVDRPIYVQVDVPATYLVRHVSPRGGHLPEDLRVEVRPPAED